MKRLQVRFFVDAGQATVVKLYLEMLPDSIIDFQSGAYKRDRFFRCEINEDDFILLKLKYNLTVVGIPEEVV